ncbi:hypothetical protein ACIBCT_35620 [Streptosporangium sp. NPDC050855]|uniref:hypothetical protein n=1 Tax=Streptosporangium sp. NPDC050855 TaxID=3366194 RepID=UPI0037909D65
MSESPSARFFVAEATIPVWLSESNHNMIAANMASHLRDKAMDARLHPAQAHVKRSQDGDLVTITVTVGAISYEEVPDAGR